MILAAQVHVLSMQQLPGLDKRVVIATTNVRQLAPFAPALHWREIR